MDIKNFRDLTLIEISDDTIFVISCDSCGGVGEKSEDIVNTSVDIVGYFTAKVALAEILAVGARPITLVDTLSVEMNDTGKRILEGVKRALGEINIDQDIAVTGSTEENFHTIQTGIGVTVIGVMHKDDFRKTVAEDGAVIVVAGEPLMGQEILENSDKIVSLNDILTLKQASEVLEILPVGSKGILNELKTMAKDAGLEFTLNQDIGIDINKSAGPASCIILAVRPECVDNIKQSVSIPVNEIGRFLGGKK
ncbi:AIR synthase related protein [Clostridiisalibacter paucivorans]|uniref:AIR synthase related protein n=1 Tax=Clostridiisalibacter paucivorans TaxID=408753 RepID=UPI00054DDD04|nr:AIR synthase related protein [Clostridiisalibacter paucivorans]